MILMNTNQPASQIQTSASKIHTRHTTGRHTFNETKMKKKSNEKKAQNENDTFSLCPKKNNNNNVVVWLLKEIFSFFFFFRGKFLSFFFYFHKINKEKTGLGTKENVS